MSSCRSNLVKAEVFYKAWESHSVATSQQSNKALDSIYQTANTAYERFIATAKNGKNRLNPNIKYLIVEQTINVSICDSIVETKDAFNRGFFEPINKQASNPYLLHPTSRIQDITLLYYTDYYKKLIQKRKRFSTESVYGLKKDKDIMAVFDGQLVYPINKMVYDDLLFNIDDMIISKDLKEVIIKMRHNFGSQQIYYKYDPKNDSWNEQRFDRWSDN